MPTSSDTTSTTPAAPSMTNEGQHHRDTITISVMTLATVVPAAMIGLLEISGTDRARASKTHIRSRGARVPAPTAVHQGRRSSGPADQLHLGTMARHPCSPATGPTHGHHALPPTNLHTGPNHVPADPQDSGHVVQSPSLPGPSPRRPSPRWTTNPVSGVDDFRPLSALEIRPPLDLSFRYPPNRPKTACNANLPLIRLIYT